MLADGVGWKGSTEPAAGVGVAFVVAKFNKLAKTVARTYFRFI
jgi:hypothetical protein